MHEGSLFDCRQVLKVQVNLESSQSLDFLSDTPPGKIFHKQAIPLSEGVKSL